MDDTMGHCNVMNKGTSARKVSHDCHSPQHYFDLVYVPSV